MASLWIDVHLTGLANSMRARADARLHVARPFSRCITAKLANTSMHAQADSKRLVLRPTRRTVTAPARAGNKTVMYRSRTRQSGTSTHLSRTCLPAAHESRASASTPLATDGQPPSALQPHNVRGKSHRSVIAWLRTGHTGFPISNGTCALHRRRNALIARPSASRHALRQTQGTSPPRIIVTRSTRSSPQRHHHL